MKTVQPSVWLQGENLLFNHDSQKNLTDIQGPFTGWTVDYDI